MYKLLRIIIVAAFFVFLISPTIAGKQDVYFLLLEYDGQNIELEKFYVTKANYVEEYKKTGEFAVEIKSFDNVLLYTRRFDIATEFTYSADPEWFDKNGNQVIIPTLPKIKEAGYKEIILPYFADGKAIAIKKGGRTVKIIPAIQFARTCGDKICQEHENALNCKNDCKKSIFTSAITAHAIDEKNNLGSRDDFWGRLINWIFG